MMASSMDAFLKPYDQMLSDIPFWTVMTAANEFLERGTRIFLKPEFDIDHVLRQGQKLSIREQDICVKPFCTLKRFARFDKKTEFKSNDPKVLIVAPLSGHYASLLRDTIKSAAHDHDVYVTDWHNARNISLAQGNFTLDNYIDYLLDFIRLLGEEELHIIAVCQPAVPVLAAVSLLATHKENCQPASMTLMGGPIDTRINPGEVNEFSTNHSIEWMRRNIITRVPLYYEGAGREVCPGFAMLNGFMSLNIDRHKMATIKLFEYLIQNDGDSAVAHRKFYDEYRSVLDMPAQYFLDSIHTVFHEHLLPKGAMEWRGYAVRPQDIKRTALMTVEGELDDISCVGQTKAAHDLCKNLADYKQDHHMQIGVGHYGIFNGRRWRSEIYPKIARFIQKHRPAHMR